VQPLVLINAVGLTPRLLAYAPRLRALADRGWVRPLHDVVPAVTCTAQATLLTGVTASVHGIVGNGWFFRETGEVRFWQQANALLQAEPLYATAHRRAAHRGRSLSIAKLFWWFNQGADVDLSLTPKPFYAADGNKAFAIHGTPAGLTDQLERALGPFPFPAFWGPNAGLPSTAWIAQAAAQLIATHHPDLTLVYLPHLDYDPQRFGPSGCNLPRLVGELDNACEPLLDAAGAAGSSVWVLSEYGHVDVSQPVLINRSLCSAGWLAVRPGPFGEVFDPFNSRAFAVCDHQVAHVYVQRAQDIPRVRDHLAELDGIAHLLSGPERQTLDLDHPRSGQIVALSRPDAWFAYPFWLDDRSAPDYARTVDIHRKPGYDPCELFFDPKRRFPRLHAARRLIQKKLGFRTLFDLIPLDPSLVRGSHGLPASTPDDGPLLLATGPEPTSPVLPMTALRDHLLAHFDLADEA
jgi:predicted AlkP superfamily pyrophosphatase or phosphodiesterase